MSDKITRDISLTFYLFSNSWLHIFHEAYVFRLTFTVAKYIGLIINNNLLIIYYILLKAVTLLSVGFYIVFSFMRGLI